jgi:hypothetical protein
MTKLKDGWERKCRDMVCQAVVRLPPLLRQPLFIGMRTYKT